MPLFDCQLVIDISVKNAAFTCNRLSQVNEDFLFEILGRPEPEELVRLDGKPLSENLSRHLIEAASWLNWADEDDEDLRVFDLGQAFVGAAETENFPQPLPLRGRETIFPSKFDQRIDLWRAGNVVRIYSSEFRKCSTLKCGVDRSIILYSADFHSLSLVGMIAYSWTR